MKVYSGNLKSHNIGFRSQGSGKHRVEYNKCTSVNTRSRINTRQRAFHSSRQASRDFGDAPPTKIRRVVVTGLGAVTPLGNTIKDTWKNILDGKSGVSAITSFNVSDLPCKVAAQVKDFEIGKSINLALLPKAATFSRYALNAASEALEDANWKPSTTEEKQRTGVSMGTGMGSLDDITTWHDALNKDGFRKFTAYFVPRIIQNMASGLISIDKGLQGPNHCVVTACATGAHSIGDASNFIRYGYADVMVAGGTESCINRLSLCGFGRMRALASKFNDTPEKASRPFDAQRNGFVMGEGAGAMVLEEYEHAKKRGAKIYAELRGYGLSGDAHDVVAPREDAMSVQYAMQLALSRGGLQLTDVDYINAHATSTPPGDVIESQAIKNLFGEHAYKLRVSSTKGATGHLLGAAGAVEAIFCVLAIRDGIIPPTINLENPDPKCDLNYVPNKAEKNEVNVALTNSFGFGGTNASLVFTSV